MAEATHVATRSARGITMTEIGLGAAQVGNLYRVTTEAEAVATIETAWQAGIRVFDTAPHYGLGLSERRVGALLSEYPRDEYLLSTKVGRLLVPTPEGADQLDSDGFVVPAATRRELDYSRDGVLRSIEASLERLGLDRIDIAYLHDPDDPEHFSVASTEGVGALIELRDQGVLSGVGAGMKDAAPLAELIRRADIDVVMCAGRLTLLDHSAHDELIPLARERGVGIVAAGVYNSGLLATAQPQEDATYDYAPADARLLARARDLAARCEQHGVTLPDAAIAYSLAEPSVVCTVVGARGRSQVTSTMTRYHTTVPDALWEELAHDGLIPPLELTPKGK